MNKYLDYDDDTNWFRWGRSQNDLEKFINNVLGVDAADGNGELKRDNAFTYKRKDCSVRQHTSTCTLMLFGTGQAMLQKKLHEIYEQNNNL